MLGWRPLVVSWINTLPAGFTDAHKKMIGDMFYRMLPASLEFVRKSGVKVRKISSFGRMVSLLKNIPLDPLSLSSPSPLSFPIHNIFNCLATCPIQNHSLCLYLVLKDQSRDIKYVTYSR